MSDLTADDPLVTATAKAIAVLADVIQQACAGADGTLDSMALSAYADGIRFLEGAGLVEIESEYGRRVIARWKARP